MKTNCIVFAAAAGTQRNAVRGATCVSSYFCE